MNTLGSQEHELFHDGRELANKAQQDRRDSKKSFALGGFALAAGALWLGGNYLVGDMTPAQEKKAVIQASVLGALGAGAIVSGAFEVRMARRNGAESNAYLAQAEALQFARTANALPDASPEFEQPVTSIAPTDMDPVQ